MPSPYNTRFNRQERYEKIEQLITNIKEAQGMNNLVSAYPEALNKLPKYTNDKEKIDKDGYVTREAGSYRENLTKTFEEALATFTKKSLDSLTLDGDYRSIYIPLQQALSTLPNQQYLAQWNDQYAEKILSLAKGQVELQGSQTDMGIYASVSNALSVTSDSKHLAQWNHQYSEEIIALARVQLELQTTLSDMENTNTYASVLSDLSVVTDSQYVETWKVDYADKVMTLLEASLPPLTESEDIYQTSKKAEDILARIPDPEAITKDSWKRVLDNTAPSATEKLADITSSAIFHNAIKQMEAAPTPEMLSIYAQEMGKEPYKTLLPRTMLNNIRAYYCDFLYEMAVKKIYNASTMDEVEVTFDLYYRHLLDKHTIHSITTPDLSKDSFSFIAISFDAARFKSDLVVHTDLKCLLLDMDATTNEDQLNKVVDEAVKLFPDLEEVRFSRFDNKFKPQYEQMQAYFINQYCDKLLELADKKIEETDSLQQLEHYYDHIDNLLQIKSLSERFYQNTEKLPFEAYSYSRDVFSTFKDNWRARANTLYRNEATPDPTQKK